MYDELVKRLRYCSQEPSGCGMCKLSDNCVLQVGLLMQAADAIEELSCKNESLFRPAVRGHWYMISYDEAGCSCYGYDRSTPFENTREAK